VSMMRILFAVLSTCLLALPSLSAQEATAIPDPNSGTSGLGRTLSGLHGRVIAEGVPIEFVAEVRLESETFGRVIASTATITGDGEFSFGPITAERNDSFYLVVDHDGFKEARIHLDDRSFFGDNDFAGFTGLIVIYLTPETPEDDDADSGPASVDVRQLTAVIPNDAREAYASALEALEDGDHERAIDHLETAVEMAPDYYDALNKLGVEYLNAGRYREAESQLENARTLGPNDPAPLINLGALHYREGQTFEAGSDQAAAAYLQAVAVLDEAVRMDPLLGRANFYLGSALYETGDWSRAEPYLLRALDLDRGVQDARIPLVMMYARQGLNAEALAQTNAFLEYAPSDAPNRAALENLKVQLEATVN
jgi:Flp pilus assembly protein TadD